MRGRRICARAWAADSGRSHSQDSDGVLRTAGSITQTGVVKSNMGKLEAVPSCAVVRPTQSGSGKPGEASKEHATGAVVSGTPMVCPITAPRTDPETLPSA